jgi:uncharacterized protein YbaA (DUF1428 family)
MAFPHGMIRASLAAVLAAAFTAGCGPSTASPQTHDEAVIKQVWQLYHSYQKRNKEAPKVIADILPMEQNLPAALGAIRSKEVLIYWGVGFSDAAEASSTVLAYQKDVPEKGGDVLMQDGATRTMSAEEFKAANKPAGATTEFQMPAGGKKKR